MAKNVVRSLRNFLRKFEKSERQSWILLQFVTDNIVLTSIRIDALFCICDLWQKKNRRKVGSRGFHFCLIELPLPSSRTWEFYQGSSVFSGCILDLRQKQSVSRLILEIRRFANLTTSSQL